MKKRILSIVTALALTLALFPAAVVPAGAASYTVTDSKSFHDALAKASDGDTIQVSGSFVVKNPVSNNDSLVIDKKVTIQGGGLTLWYCGILLGADVTFRNITLGLAPNERNAIMANGHTLTLENVQRDPTARYIHLFCGGLTGGEQESTRQGDHGKIILKGNTNLGLTNIYAGSISTNGGNNVFGKPATVTVEPSVTGTPIENIYACGAMQTHTSEENWFDYEHEIDPPFASPGNFQVGGIVTFNLYQGMAKRVSGDTGVGGNLAQVNYSGNGYLNDDLILHNIGGLAVAQNGNLAPIAGSLQLNVANRITSIEPDYGRSFMDVDRSLSVAEKATLGLQNLGSPVSVGDFSGGGNLVLGVDQKLTVAGNVLGNTTVGIGGIFNGHSQAIPTENFNYIDATSSQADSFTLAAPASRPDIELEKDGSAWIATGGHKSADTIVDDFALSSVVIDSNQTLASLPFEYVTYAPNSFANLMGYVPLQIQVNTVPAPLDEDDGRYKVSGLVLVTGDDGTNEDLQIETANSSALTGTYVIEVTVPAEYSGTGKPVTRTATLTVKAAGGGTTVIPVPTANTGLVYNGQEQVGVSVGGAYELVSGPASATDAGDYEAKVTPAAGFTWTDGKTDPVNISWSIGRAEGPAAPTGLSAAAPSTYNGSDGAITGTTEKMEYADNSGFTGAKSCTATETTGLTPGDYYVRIAENTNYKAGAAIQVTVPQGPITVQSVKISDGASYKTAYKVGDTLDVTGLTLAVTMTNGLTYTVPVAAGMVSGFDSSAVNQKQTLTVTYGREEVTYDITIAEADPTDPTDPTDPVAVTGVTLNKSAMSLTVGSAEQLTATVSPDNASNKNVTWGSDNTAVAAVDANGKVTAAGTGTAVITVTTEDGNKTASCTVTVNSNGGGGSTDGNYTGGGSSTSNTTSNTTTNADGSVSTTVTDRRTGTVTTTTKNTDGSITVVEAKKDGTVTITDTAKNGVKVQAVSKPETDTTARVTVPTSVKTAAVIVPVAVTPGMVAVDAKTGEVVKLSVPTEGGMAVKLDGSANLILVDRSKPFTDTDGHWAKDEIDFATAHAMFDGTSATTFSPNDAMTRGMIAVVLHNFEDNPEFTTQNSFSDVDPGDWYADGVNWMIYMGITGGYGDGSFGTNDVVSREQLVTFLYRYASSMDYSTAEDADLSSFADGDSVSGYAAEAMRWAVGSGLIVGSDGGALDPRGSATRAQVAAILKRFVVNLTR